jgi:hypothetical protein
MHPSLESLERAAELARQEFGLLEREDVAGLGASADERLRLINEAWAGKGECDADEFSRQLLRLRNLQRQLDEKARRLHAETGETLKKRQQASRAIQGYGFRGKRSMFAQVVAKNS